MAGAHLPPQGPERAAVWILLSGLAGCLAIGLVAAVMVLR